jgi:hypothetical protein
VIVAIPVVSTGSVCKCAFVRARTYRLEVEGEVGDCSWCQLEGMSSRYEQGNTVLVGLIRDQAELQSLLQRVSDLGLTLVSVNPIAKGSQT